MIDILILHSTSSREDTLTKKNLIKHLYYQIRDGRVRIVEFSFGNIKNNILRHYNNGGVVVVLASADFISDDKCIDILNELSNKNKVFIVYSRYVDLELFKGYSIFPKDKDEKEELIPIHSNHWANKDRVFRDTAQNIAEWAKSGSDNSFTFERLVNIIVINSKVLFLFSKRLITRLLFILFISLAFYFFLSSSPYDFLKIETTATKETEKSLLLNSIEFTLLGFNTAKERSMFGQQNLFTTNDFNLENIKFYNYDTTLIREFQFAHLKEESFAQKIIISSDFRSPELELNGKFSMEKSSCLLNKKIKITYNNNGYMKIEGSGMDGNSPIDTLYYKNVLKFHSNDVESIVARNCFIEGVKYNEAHLKIELFQDENLKLLIKPKSNFEMFFKADSLYDYNLFVSDMMFQLVDEEQKIRLSEKEVSLKRNQWCSITSLSDTLEVESLVIDKNLIRLKLNTDIQDLKIGNSKTSMKKEKVTRLEYYFYNSPVKLAITFISLLFSILIIFIIKPKKIIDK